MTDESRSRALTALAARQHGLVTTNQLRHLGFDADATRRLCRAGWLHRVAWCVYAVGHPTLTRDAELLAGVITYGAAGRLSDDSAILAHGLLPPWEEPAVAPIHVTVPPALRVAQRAGTTLHRRALPAAECTRLGPLPVVRVERALREFGITATTRRLERAVDEAVVEGKTNPAALRRAVAVGSGSPGVAVLRAIVRSSEGYATLTRSQLEEALLAITRAALMPTPALNVRVAGITGRLDAWFAGPRVGVEVDGWAWHRSGQRQHLDRTKELQARRAGIVLVRYSARQVFEERVLVAADLAATLARRS